MYPQKISKIENHEDAFKLIGLDAFFNVEDDKIINWIEFFQLTNDEEFYAANNNQITEDDKNENQIWSKY